MVVTKVIILKPTSEDIKLYNIEKRKKQSIYKTRKPKINGFFTLKKIENKIELWNIELKKDNTNIIITNEELIKILKKQNIIITKKDKMLAQFLKQHNIRYNIMEICENCEKQKKIQILKKNHYTYKQQLLCKKCAKKIIKKAINQNGYDDYKNIKLDIILKKHEKIEEIIELMKEEYNPLKNKEFTLYDVLPATEEEYEKITVDELNLPLEFKEELNKRIDTLLPVQISAIKNGLLDNENLLVVSQTASGKTLIGELAGIPKALDNKKMIYLSPLVALANQKYRDFKRYYEKLGLKTVIKVGHNRIKDKHELFIEDEPAKDADIIVATYEGLDYILRSGNYRDLEELGLVIIDEIHMLENEERGHRLNGLIHRLLTIYPQSQIIGLSATIKNSKTLSEEFDMKLVEYDKRPVAIERHLLNVKNSEDKNNMLKKLCENEFEMLSSKGYHGQTIIFTDSRRKTQIITKNLKKNGVKAEYYHAGLTYERKLMIEEAFINQEISTIVTTSALANGIDFPASMVIFESLRMGYDWLNVNDFHQMLGRAGRPTYHDIGHVFILVEDQNYPNDLNESNVAINLLESDVGNINVLYSDLDVYEQVLSDICAIPNLIVEELEDYYDNLWISIMFNEALSLLEQKNMITYDHINDTYNATNYGKAISKSFINIREADIIRNNLYEDIFDIVTSLEKIRNVYLSQYIIKNISKITDINIRGTRLFTDFNKRILFTGAHEYSNSRNLINKINNIIHDFMECDCDYPLNCNCIEKNISKHIIERRLQGWSPTEISKEFKREYELVIYPGDIYSYLDQVIMMLEAIKRISLSSHVTSTAQKAEKMIKKIEG